MKAFYAFCTLYFVFVSISYAHFVWPMYVTHPWAFYTLSFIACAFTLMMAFVLFMCIISDISDMRNNKERNVVRSVKKRLNSFISLMSKCEDNITFISNGNLDGQLVVFYARSTKYSAENNCGFSVGVSVDSSSNELKVEWYDNRRTNAKNVQLYDFLTILDYLLNVSFISDCGIERVSFDGATKKILNACSVLEPVQYTICDDGRYSLIWERKSWNVENSLTVESNKQLYDEPTIPHMEAIKNAYPSIEACELQLGETVVK